MKPACYDITPTLQSYGVFFWGSALQMLIKLIGVVLDA